MRLKQLLNESDINRKERKEIIKLIKRPKNTKIVLNSQMGIVFDEEDVTVDVKKGRNGVTFIYNADLYNVSNGLIDIIDNMDDYKYKFDLESPTNTVYLEVIKK